MTMLAKGRVVALMQGATWDAGLLGAAASHHLASGGGAWRACLALDCCMALGVPDRDAAGLAAACELVHQAYIVHDDAQDGSPLRRGRPSVAALYGTPVAICTGDHFLAAAFGVLAALPSASGLVGLFAARIGEMVAGQAEEFYRDLWVSMTWDRYALLAGAKAGALVSLPVEGAALLAGLPGEVAGLAARQIGLAYQAGDDVADLAPDLTRGALNGVIARALDRGVASRRDDLLHPLAKAQTGTTCPTAVARQVALLAPEAGWVLAWAGDLLGSAVRLPDADPLVPVLVGVADALAERLGVSAPAI